MLPKKNRVSTNEVDKIFKEGKFLNSPNLTFKYIRNQRNQDKEIKISFIAPKSVAKLAVTRNLLRRRGYSALGEYLREYISEFPSGLRGLRGVFVFKKYQDDITTINNEIKNILDKIN
ncbi:hypothetical protein A2917_03055 [Candidatus Nomurabacteria bacterium RIFCSPLOWO2_01_FULL_42_17]|uniref:Uncharacterized protein n=1 Tax=Candidatus Nomurabacteria bacterium RIFCSPLOWO2_01_FULL_42_17 TaxID=1801780 RepID=A0A1F6XND6_9BACT|nr:MAG: hypothetical protein A2917_03055 [Candidatus Nomurabacteria bacterium RIFCSPLOWO2_01_FULL_42_17]